MSQHLDFLCKACAYKQKRQLQVNWKQVIRILYSAERSWFQFGLYVFTSLSDVSFSHYVEQRDGEISFHPKMKELPVWFWSTPQTPEQKETKRSSSNVVTGAGIIHHDQQLLLRGYSREEPMPVEVRHHVSFHVVHYSSFLGLIDGECFQRLSIVVKLREDHFVVVCNQRAWSVAIVLDTRKWLITK